MIKDGKKMKGQKEDGSGAIIISLVSSVPSKKISHICGLTRVIRTFIDLQAVPVSWSSTVGGSDHSEEEEVWRVGAKNMVAEEGAVRFLQAAVEDLCVHLGLEQREANAAAVAAVIGDPNVRPMLGEKDQGGLERGEGGEERSGEQSALDFGVFQPAMSQWKESISPSFFDVFAKEVLAKDLPSLL